MIEVVKQTAKWLQSFTDADLARPNVSMLQRATEWPESTSMKANHSSGRQQETHTSIAPVTTGTDVAFILEQPGRGPVPFTYWDLWFALVAERNFNGDLEGLAQHFRTELKTRHHQAVSPQLLF